jgi:formylglycine-generating enzyme required for sulfatase activity
LKRLIEIYGLDEVQKLDEASLPLSIGSDDQNHIRLPGSSGTVAHVGESRDHLFLQPATGNSFQYLIHNNHPITSSVWLKSGDSTRIGDFLIRWQLSSQLMQVRISRYTVEGLTPPAELPEHTDSGNSKEMNDASLPAVIGVPGKKRHKYRSLVLFLFILLLSCAAFVLLAKPLTVSIKPAPENLSVTGFPPPLKLGNRYLGFPGSYLLRAEKSGYRPLEEQVEITTAGSSYSFTFDKLPGYLDVASSPPGATLLVDGVSVGATPLAGVELPIGRRSLRFELQRYQPLKKTLTVMGAGERLNLQVDLLPAWARVAVQSEPAGANLSVDGVEQGQTPLELDLLAGKRQLTLQKGSFSPLEVTLEVTAGNDMSPGTFKLTPAPASLVITSEPKGATVTANGTYKGQTPLTISLSSEIEHDIRLTAAGYLPQSRKLKLAAEDKRNVSFRLEQQFGVVFIAVTPPDATLYIDGKKQQLATGRFRLTTRPHTLELRAKGYQNLSRTVTPRSGYSQQLEIDLLPVLATASTGRKTNSPSPAPATKTITAVGQKLVHIQPRPFLMGASRREPGRRANEAERQVVLQRSFYISIREVTNSEYRQFQPQHSSGTTGNRSLEIDSHPVVNVSWDEAVRFLNWLSNKDRLPPYYHEQNGKMVATDPRGIGYRLPTEAEWAFAARMADRKDRARYPWPGSYPPKSKAGNFADESARHLLPMVIDNYNDGFPATAPAGSFAANKAGIFDLGGNVAEWCHDFYSPGGVASKDGAIDPLGAESGNHHLVRGSSWRDASMTELRFSYRRYSRSAASDIGFRVARYAK